MLVQSHCPYHGWTQHRSDVNHVDTDIGIILKAGQIEEWVEELPGMPDGVGLSSDGHFWVNPFS